MKKAILLLTFIFLLSGCYDYQEVNNLGIISAIGIDYEDDKYIITLEILNDSGDKESSKISSYTKTNSDKSLAKAIEKTADLIADKANYIRLFCNNINYYTAYCRNFQLILSQDSGRDSEKSCGICRGQSVSPKYSSRQMPWDMISFAASSPT